MPHASFPHHRPRALALAVTLLHAQDTRKVREPHIPPACTTLTATLTTTSIVTTPPTPQSAAPANDTEPPLDTAPNQHALDTCTRGHAVVLASHAANDAFLTGPLQLRANVALVIQKGVTLYGSRNPAVYETAPGSCGIITPPAHPMDSVPLTGCSPLLLADHGRQRRHHGRRHHRRPRAAASAWIGKPLSWWGLAELTRPGYGHQVGRILEAKSADNFTLYRITLRNSQNAHFNYNGGDGLTVWGVKIDTPKRLARNTDGIDPGNGARNITITHTYIRAGDDDIAIKGGPGGVNNMTVSHSHFYWGHGMAIGSPTIGGVGHILVTDLSLDGPDNAIRIKSNGSRGGLTHDVTFSDICDRDSPNPIVLDTGYTAGGELKGDLPTLHA